MQYEIGDRLVFACIARELVLDDKDKGGPAGVAQLLELERMPGQNDIGMVAWPPGGCHYTEGL